MQGPALSLDRATLASAAHDLRNPLAVILGMTTVLRARAMPRDRDCLDAIATECNRLSRMVDNLMAVTRIDAAPNREWIPADDLASAAIARLEGLVTGVSVALEIQSGVLVHVEPGFGELLLLNVLEHLAWTADGRIQLAIRHENGNVTIDVHGPAPADGNGTLGLEIARRIAEAHDGRLEKLSPTGGGALVRVELPDAGERPAPATEVTR